VVDSTLVSFMSDLQERLRSRTEYHRNVIK
jgi:hypothetical protein